MDIAAAEGNLGVMQWLLQHRAEFPESCSHPYCTSEGFRMAVANGQFQAVQWLYAHKGSFEWSIFLGDDQFSIMCNRHPDIMQWWINLKKNHL